MNDGNSEAAAAGMLGSFGVICFCFVLLVSVIKALFCWYLADVLKRVPQPHRRMSPAQVWLWMIPVFEVVWAFFIARRIPGSVRAALDAQGRTEGGNCGRRIGMAWAILNSLAVPLVVLTWVQIRVAMQEEPDFQTALKVAGGLKPAAYGPFVAALGLLIGFSGTADERAKLLTK